MAKIKIALDSGHGSETAGKRTCKLTKDIGEFKKGTQVREHWINTYICSRIAMILESKSYEVFKSAWDDENVKDDVDVALTTRQKGIKNAKCDYSVSVHLNASGDGMNYNSAQGTEVLVHNNPLKVGDSQKLADYVLAEIIKGTKQINRGVKSQELALCNCLNTGCKASILVECAFMTNLNEVNTMITQEDYWNETAQQIADGTDKYIQSMVKVTETKITTKVKESIKKVITKSAPKTGYIKVLVETLNIRKKPTWDADDVCGTIKKGEVYTVKEKIGGGFYLLKSGVYVTSSPKYVEYYEK